jgi:hypothetical protein
VLWLQGECGGLQLLHKYLLFCKVPLHRTTPP